MSDMLCQHCQKNPMTMKITKIVHGVATEYSICDECAPKISGYYKKMQEQNSDKAQVENLLKELLEQGGATIEKGAGGVGGQQDEDAKLLCENCGLSYADFRKSFMLGCANCYDAFGDKILTDIRKIHGSTRHTCDSGSSGEVVEVESVEAKEESPSEVKEVEVAEETEKETAETVETVDFKALLRDLQNQLKQSIEKEDFDRAVELRDEIAQLKEKIEQQEGQDH